jgi:hypothetical protein
MPEPRTRHTVVIKQIPGGFPAEFRGGDAAMFWGVS